ncbi:MAG: hypothetical protein L6Q54_13950 [Leptospiraceae bacterium]|nr:hypothetical protein [Leptospiraceae bacterium]MCK6382338.1 hypothetical protein [Leptospiraceae bacterium]NUM40365.1 hypothetical protein [Leptospiraceae bacterium]
MVPQSRTDAHKVFANLYRKSRSPEHQQKIDEILTRSNDVFIRIDLIKKADEEFYKSKNGGETEEEKTSEKKQSAKPQPKKIVKPENKPTGGGGGFLSALFGGNAAIAQFAKNTGAIELGIFGRKPAISSAVEAIFKGLREDQIIATIQALKLCETQGWRHWAPLVYNIINNYNRFFNSFIGLDSLFIDEISAETFLNRSTKMQMYYGRVLSRPDTRDIILTNVPTLVKLDEKLSPKIESILTGLDYGLSLEDQKPTLRDAICAFHIVMSKRVVTWDEIVRGFNISPIDELKFKSSPEVTKEVEMAIAKLEEEIKTGLFSKKELQNLKSRYFRIDETGKLNFDFLNEIIDDYVNRHYPESMQNASVKSNFKSIPHKLLYLIIRDFQSVYFSLIEGYIKIEEGMQTKDVLLIQSGLFLAEIEKINMLIRSIDGFNKKYPSFQYSFQLMSEKMIKGAQDQIESALLKLLSGAGEIFGRFAQKIDVLIENHLLAKEYERNGQLNEKILTTRERPIEEVKILHRFIPYYNTKIITQSRIAGKTIEEVFTEMTKLLYNYAIIYKDTATTQKLTAHKKIEADLARAKTEYERLAGKPFEQDSHL